MTETGNRTIPDRALFHSRDKGVNNIIDINQRQGIGGITYLNGKTMCNVIAEGGYHTVVRGAAPLPEYARQAIHQCRRTGGAFMGKEKFLRLMEERFTIRHLFP